MFPQVSEVWLRSRLLHTSHQARHVRMLRVIAVTVHCRPGGRESFAGRVAQKQAKSFTVIVSRAAPPLPKDGTGQ